jgi:PAS domain S-box-containing protein
LVIVLGIIFAAEVAVMLVLPYITPTFVGDTEQAIIDALLLTLICAPALWWVIIGPLRRIAIQEHERSQTIVANAGEGILTFSHDGTVFSCNSAGSKLFGVDAAVFVGRSIRTAIPGLPRSFGALPHTFRLDCVSFDGKQFPAQVSISRISQDDQSLLIGIVRDLTESQKAEREKIEREALRAQQMATLAQLATGVAHEIRNPLTSIKMLVQVNRDKFAEQGLPTEDLELVEQEIRRMERSVNGLLEYARPEKAEFQNFALQEPVGKAARLIEGRCNSQNIVLHCEMPEQPLCLFGDPAQIQQLLLNLCINALDAMPQGGELRMAARQERETLCLTVSDTGGGIDDAVLGKLFSPFVTTKPHGVGLGLGICRRIAETHRGRLDGTNAAGGGARFELTLPLVFDRQPQPVESA